MCFIPSMKLHKVINTIDGIKKINHIQNLEIPKEDLGVLKFLDDLRQDSFEYHKNVMEESYSKYLEEKKFAFANCIPEQNRAVATKFLDLPRYNEFMSPFFIDQKPVELEYLYSVASKKDGLGELRIPADYFPKFSKFSINNLKQLEPLLFHKNIFRQWTFPPEFFLGIDKYTENQVDLINRLVNYKIEPKCAIQIAENSDLKWDKIVEKAESLNKIYPETLREINFFINKLGEKWLCAEIQLPPNKEKPQMLNYEEVFSKIDDDINPIERLNLKTDIDSLVENIYSKIAKNICKFGEKDLDRITTHLVNEVPNTDKREVLTVIQKITQFANYSSINPLAKKLKDLNIGIIGSYGELGPIFQYFHKYKNLLELSDASV